MGLKKVTPEDEDAVNGGFDDDYDEDEGVHYRDNGSPFMRICCDGCYSENCCSAAYFLSAFFFLAGVGMLIGFGVKYVHPFLRGQSMVPSVCEVVEANYTGGHRQCVTKAGRMLAAEYSTYKCLQVWVKLWDTRNTSVLSQRTMLHWDEYTFADKFGCTFSLEGGKCSKYNNDDHVTAYRNRHLPGSTTPCFFNPTQKNDVIQQRKEGAAKMVMHMMLWSTVLVVISILSCTIACWQCGLIEDHLPEPV